MGFFNPSDYETRKKVVGHIPLCGECGLYKKCYSPKMEPQRDGEKTRDILILTSNPSVKGDRHGQHIVESEEPTVINALEQCSVYLEDVWTYSVVCCKTNKPTHRQMSNCRPKLLDVISKTKPKVIITLGIFAAEAVLKELWNKTMDSVEKWVGWTIPVHEYGAWVCPTYSEWDVLNKNNDPILQMLVKEHIKKAVLKEKEDLPDTDLDSLQNKVQVILNEDLAVEKLQELQKKEGIIAFDYETTGLKPDSDVHEIVSCAFCYEGVDTFAYMMTPRTMKETSKVLKSPDLLKVAANLKYEERWTKAKMGHRVKNWYWDTMLSSHVIDNRRGITSLKFQAFVQFGVPGYDSYIEPFFKGGTTLSQNKIHEADIQKLLLYNGLDALLEYMLMEEQKNIFQ